MKALTWFLFFIVAGLTVAAQYCKGKNRSGLRCGITVGLSKDSLCRWHDTASQCGARRSNGLKCRLPKNNCPYHKKKIVVQATQDHKLISVIYYDRVRRDTFALDYLTPRQFKRQF